MTNRQFGEYGGRFVPEVLVRNLEELEKAFDKFRNNANFKNKLNDLLRNYAGRPTSLYFAKHLSEFAGAKIFLKREDLLHGGAHKINNTLGQALLAKEMGKTRIIAETGAGQHGTATAMACAMLGLKCEIFMGEEDVLRQRPNVLRMKLCGAKVNIVNKGSKKLKDAINEALRDWITNVEDTYYLIGSVVGPHPYPTIVREFQKVIGIETRKQVFEQTGKLPDAIIACVGGGSNAIGIFNEFLGDNGVKLIGVEAGGVGLDSDKHAATLSKGERGVFHGAFSYFLQDEFGGIKDTHSIAPGLDYAGVGPQHAFLKDSKRVEYVIVTDKESMEAFKITSRLEGIIPALESSHAIAYAMKISKDLGRDSTIIINLSGRGDKDIDILEDADNDTN